MDPTQLSEVSLSREGGGEKLPHVRPAMTSEKRACSRSSLNVAIAAHRTQEVPVPDGWDTFAQKGIVKIHVDFEKSPGGDHV